MFSVNDTFPSSQLTITSPLLGAVVPDKRESVLSTADGKLKSLNLRNSMIIAHTLESSDTRMDAECIFDRIIRNPPDHSRIVPDSTFNKFTFEMRMKLAKSLGI